jgi:tRNA-dihydrouridine synthase B
MMGLLAAAMIRKSGEVAKCSPTSLDPRRDRVTADASTTVTMPRMQIGPYVIEPNVVLAPMAGVTDKPFRLLCKRLGAGLAVSEMTTSDPRFWTTRKSMTRMDHVDEPAPISVQIAGTIPEVLAEAARHNVAHGAQIIDINMGCPAKKVCNAWAGSALMQDEALVARILAAVVQAVAAFDQPVPVTLKIRTGWDREHRNALSIARLANGDIATPQQAKFVLDYTGADAVMIGRAAQGRPWILREIAHYLATGDTLPEPSLEEIRTILLGHLHALHAFYGEQAGVRIARKHLGWYLKSVERGPDGRFLHADGNAYKLPHRPENTSFRAVVNRVETAADQVRLTAEYFDRLVSDWALAA